ncbi:RkpR, polysaccharide export protein [Stappia sp. F7233]|uniref:RkpR, polysaccharide export protein n=1 Tax=Stappia albiluteola TaxID=2758565 RepID=A0A839AAV0_9HYPH|nr:RkpR, polysaccharide export protein [Stappia albiluteola]MBA5776316.1 RkpR, polysaccharide export protein [Stappia albiluteola]
MKRQERDIATASSNADPVDALNVDAPDSLSVRKASTRGRRLAVISGTAISTRLKDAGLDPVHLIRQIDPTTHGRGKLRLRHRFIVLGFLLGVVLPSLAVSTYMAFIAADQYHSKAAFAVRSVDGGSPADLLGLIAPSGRSDNVSNSYIISDYLQNQVVIEDVSKSIDIDQIFNRSSADWFFKLGTGRPIEDKLEYWNNMVSVNYDPSSGLIFVEARAFSPEDAQAITNAILERSEFLVNNLSDSAQRESVRFAKEEVAHAEARLKVFRKQLLNFRQTTQEISPTENARITLELIGTLEQQLTKNEAELKTLNQYLDPESPQIRILKRQIQSLREQISAERARLGYGSSTSNGDAALSEDKRGDTISGRIASYEELELEREFAERLYTAALSGLEKARADADAKQTYLAVFLRPTLSEDAQYPHRLLISLATFLALFGVWLASVLIYYNMRDRS